MLPGVTAVPAHDTHTAGSQYVTLDQHDGRWLLAGDNCYTYENFLGSQEDGRALDVSGFHAGYGRYDVVRDLALHVEQGEAVALLGPNGAGKTTFLLALMGLVKHRRGRGHSVLLVEQRVDLAARVCDRVYVLSGGEIVLEETIEAMEAEGHAMVSAYLG